MNAHELIKPFEPSFATDSPPGNSELADRDAAELLSAILDVKVSTAQRFLSRLGGVKGLCIASDLELTSAGIHAAKARRLRHSIALARAGVGARPSRGDRLAGASEVWVHMRARLADLPVEEFWAIAVDVRHSTSFLRAVASRASKFTRGTSFVR